MNTEIKIMRYIQNHMRSTYMDKIMIFSSKSLGFAVPLILTSIFSLSFKKYRFAITTIIAIAFTPFICEHILKKIWHRARPHTNGIYCHLIIPPPPNFSFPSSHAATAFSYALLVQKANGKVGIFAMSFAAIISFSRVYLFVHYPSDVIAGAGVGLISAQTIYSICDGIPK
ncbi:MAG: phosphatase PAP2 family protein [Oscillospiraceae bacterium]|jgi:undecaprenyl-diphosphatase|nr:phosphatase PAP2 family protein [Oscillospiraceae bacterium]